MENNNSVCFIARINEIKPIEGADNIEQGVIGGWNCIIKKGEYKVDDLVAVATTDAVIPQKLSDAMDVTNYLRKGGRVRTVKLRGVYSECLIIPFSMFVGRTKHIKTAKEGDDLMESLGIFKYEPPVKLIQLSSGRKIRYSDNPNFGVYYKFPNLKNVQGMFTEDDIVEITRKLHGTNARFGIVKKSKLGIVTRLRKLFGDKWAEYEYVYGSHNVEKGSDSQGFYSTDVWAEVAEKYDIKEKLWSYIKEISVYEEVGDGVILYGEIYGFGIQKNYDYGLKDIQFAGFDLFVNREYSNTFKSHNMINHYMQLQYVPILYTGTWSQEIQDSFVFDNFIEGSKIPHEGIVIKHTSGERIKVAKQINPAYSMYSEKNDIGDSH